MKYSIFDHIPIISLLYKRYSVYKKRQQHLKRQVEYLCNSVNGLCAYLEANHKPSPPKEKIIYTCITGEYDKLILHSYTDPEYQYICFTDSFELLQHKRFCQWEIQPLQFSELDNPRNNRWHKTHPHILFPNYKSSIYIDANIDIKTSYIFDLIKKQKTSLLIPKHHERDCAYDESKFCLKIKKDRKEDILATIDLMKKAQFPKHFGLTENNLIYREHNNPIVISTMDKWWEIIQYYSKRDQLSLSYCLWLNSINPADHSFPNTRNQKQHFKIYQHHQ